MSLRLTAATALSALALLTAGMPAAYAGEQVVNASDPAGDVVLTSDSGGLSVAQRRSIDMTQVSVVVGADVTRFAIRLKQITVSKDFDQMVFVTLSSPPKVSPAYRTDIGMSAQSRDLAYAYYSPDTSTDDLEVCDPLTAKVRKKARVIFLDVPHSCLPPDPVKIRLTSATGFFRSEGGGYSRDRLKVVGTYDVQ